MITTDVVNIILSLGMFALTFIMVVIMILQRKK